MLAVTPRRAPVALGTHISMPSELPLPVRAWTLGPARYHPPQCLCTRALPGTHFHSRAWLSDCCRVRGRYCPRPCTASWGHSGLSCNLVPLPHVAGYLLVLARTELSLHSMEVVNRLTNVVALPSEFMHMYIANSMHSCESQQVNLARVAQALLRAELPWKLS